LHNPVLWRLWPSVVLEFAKRCEGGAEMRLSARNQLKGTIVSVKLGEVMAEVTLDLGHGQQITSAITRASAESLGLKAGMAATAIIKSTEVVIGVE